VRTATYSYLLEPPPPPEPSLPRRIWGSHAFWLVTLALAGCELAGLGAVVNGYRIARGTLTSTSEFTWFWLGMIVMLLPVAALIARAATPRGTRAALLILYGCVSYAPKLLRDPTAPAFHDEFAHWRATEEILSTGKLFQPNTIVPIISQYPGLHAVTAALVHATGLTIWQSATALLIMFHVMLLLGVAALAEAVGLNSRTASLAALLYSLNSSFLYFDTQFAYESMAITLVVWALAMYARAIRSPRRRGRRTWCVLTLLFAAGAAVTHHLSTIILVVVMTLLALSLSVPALARRDGWRRTAVTAWGLTLTTAAMAGAWYYFVAPATLAYLSPYLGEGVTQLLRDVGGSGSARQLFGASLSPWWEQRSAYVVTMLALALAAGGLLILRSLIKRGRLAPGRRRALRCGFATLGLVYFPSTLFIFSAAGAEGARRSWAFSWIGLSVLMAPAAVWLIDRAGRRAVPWRRISALGGLLVMLAAAQVGGTAAGLDASYRFPGPFLYGSDARSDSPELLAAATWFRDRFGAGNNLVTDRYTGLVFGSFGLQETAEPSAGFPTYDLYLAKPGQAVSPVLLAELDGGHYTYLVVDERMAYDVPEIGVYFEPSEPPSLVASHGESIFAGRLAKFDTITWLVKVFSSDDYAVYRLTLPPAQQTYQHPPPRARGSFRVAT